MSRPYKHPKTGIYWFRAKVPAAFRQIAGKELVTWTLMTKDQNEALRHWPDALKRWEAMKAEWGRKGRAEMLTKERAREIAAVWGAWVAQGDKLDRGGVDRVPKGYEPHDAILERVKVHTQEALRLVGLEAAGDTVEVLHKEMFAMVLGAYRDSIIRERAKADDMPVWQDFLALTRAYYPEVKALPDDKSAAPATQPSLTFDAAWEGWKVVTTNSPRTVDDALRVLRQLQGFLGHSDAARVTRDDVLRWRDAMKADGKSNTTWNNRLSLVGEVFKRAVKDGRIGTNPTDGLRLEKSRTVIRKPYSDEDAALILKAARKETSPALRWSHWIMAFTGMRVGEVLQLTKGDIKTDPKSGVRYLDVRPDPQAGKTVKTDRPRHVPIHPALEAEGFVKFVATIRSDGEDVPLFPEKGLDKYGRRGGRAWNLVGKWVKKATKINDPAKAPNHSWRHRMEDELRAAEVPEDARDAIMGHARKTTGREYGMRGEALSRLSRELSKITLPSGVKQPS
jgi:integrase